MRMIMYAGMYMFVYIVVILGTITRCPNELMDNIRERALATREHEAGNQEGVSSRRWLLCVTNSRAVLREVVSEATRVGVGPA